MNHWYPSKGKNLECMAKRARIGDIVHNPVDSNKGTLKDYEAISTFEILLNKRNLKIDHPHCIAGVIEEL